MRTIDITDITLSGTDSQGAYATAEVAGERVGVSLAGDDEAVRDLSDIEVGAEVEVGTETMRVSGARVASYETSERLQGRPSAELIEASEAEGSSGAVPAYRDADGVWQYVRPDEVEHYERQLGETVVTVYTEA